MKIKAVQNDKYSFLKAKNEMNIMITVITTIKQQVIN